jgi:hypothetical protein
MPFFINEIQVGTFFPGENFKEKMKALLAILVMVDLIVYNEY